MASPAVDYLRSPFDNVFSYLPQGHNKALKQAFYNAAASFFLVLVCCAAIAVYYILEAFLRPLLWAVLCGTFLHPFKSTLTTVVRGWLKNLRRSGTPLALGTLLLPVQIVNRTSESLGSVILTHIKAIMGGAVGLPLCYLFYHFAPLGRMFSGMQTTFCFISEALNYFSAIWVWSLVVAYALVVIFFWSPQSSPILKPLSIPVWIALVFHLVMITGPLRVPLLILVIALMAVGFVSEVNEARKKQLAAGTDAESPSLIAAWKILWGKNRLMESYSQESFPPPPSPSPSPPPAQLPDSTEVQAELVGAASEHRDTPRKPQSPESNIDVETPLRPLEGVASDPFRLPRATKGERPTGLGVGGGSIPGGSRTSSEESLPREAKQRSLSDMCFIGLFWALVIVRIWVHFWVIQLLPILVACLILKKLGVHVSSWKWVQDKAKGAANHFRTTICNDKRVDILAPKPLRGLGKLILRGDRKVVASLEGSTDKFMSIFIVLLLFFGSLLGTFFMLVQVHKESVHLVTVTSNLMNKTLHPDLTQWLPDNMEMQETMDSMVSNAYIYGRKWIAEKLHTVDGDDVAKKDVEKQVLQVWDRLYENFFARTPIRANHTLMKPELHRQMTLDFIDMSNVSSVYDVMAMAKNFNFDIMEFAKEHVGILVSVLESIWAVLKGNINLALSVLWAAVSLLFGGGTALLNFVLSMVVFITTLFYLLASSGERYKPVEWFASFTPTQGGGQGNKLGQAVEEAISSVFLASLKMAAFYGLYTWITHTIFGIQIVFIPSALAAIFAAIPFVGTYIAAVPALIELWFVNGQKISAILLLVFHLLPMFFVDTAFYSEVKGGHPYLTGLAIAGGMYWMGLEGAIIGPILLCCLIVAMNVYSTMLKPEERGMTAEQAKRHRVSALASEKRVTFNLQRGFSSPDSLEG